MNQLLAFLKSIDLVISRITRFICIVSMMIIFVMFLLNVLVRFVPVYNFTQTDEWTQLFLDVITDRIAGTPAGKICRIISTVIEAIMYATICYYGFVLVERAESYMLTITWLQKRYFYLVIPVSAFFMTCYSIRDVVQALSMPWNAPKQAQNQA